MTDGKVLEGEALEILKQDSAVTDLSGILLTALKALAGAGEAEQASRLSGRACAVLRHGHHREWQGFNALLHRLSRQTGPVGVPASSSQC